MEAALTISRNNTLGLHIGKKTTAVVWDNRAFNGKQ
jgi:hypothetical protein